jgi:surface protein
MKKLITFIILILLFIPISVFADESKLKILSVELINKSDSAEVLEDASFNNLELNTKLKFKNIDDFVKYKLIVKNESDGELNFDNAISLSGDEYFDYKVDYENDSRTIPAGKESIVYVKTFYKNNVPTEYFRSASYNSSSSVSLGISKLSIINIPDTLKNLGIREILLIVFIVVIITYSIILIIKNKKVSGLNIFIIMLLLTLIPIKTTAEEEYTLIINSDVIVDLTKVNPCTYDGTLTQGVEFKISDNGQYTYRYMQQGTASGWENISTDGWGVKLTDPSSTEDTTEVLCTTINDKPIVSMSYMHYGSQASKIDLTSYATTEVTNMNYMFANADQVESLTFETFNTEKTTTMDNMFNNVSNIKKLFLGNFVTPNLLKINSLVEGASSLIELNMDGWDISKITSKNVLYNTPSLNKLSFKNWILGSKSPYIFNNDNTNGWYGKESPVETVDVTGWDLSNTTNLNDLFINGSSVKEFIGTETWDMKNVTTITDLFCFCSSVEHLNLDGWDMTSLSNPGYSAFAGMVNLKTLSMKGWKLGDNNPYLGQYMYLDTRILDLQWIDVTDWDLGDKTSLAGIFGQVNASEIRGLETWDTSKITNMSSLFRSLKKVKKLDLSGWDTSNVTNFNYLFEYSTGLEELNLTGWDFSKAQNNSYWFDSVHTYLKKLILKDVKINTKTSDIAKFYDKLEYIDVTNLDISTLTSLADFFSVDRELKEIVGLNTWDTSNITNFNSMFNGLYKLEELDISGWDLSNVTTINLFYNMGLNTSFVTPLKITAKKVKFPANGYQMFAFLTRIGEIDLENADFTNVTNMECFFYYLNVLTKLNLKGIDTSNVTNMKELFRNNPLLEEIDVSSLNTSKVTNMQYMFAELKKIKKIKGLDKLDTSKVENFNYMFQYCNELEELDLTTIDTSSAKTMLSPYDGLIKITKLDFSNFDLSKLEGSQYGVLDTSSLTELVTPKVMPNMNINLYKNWYSKGNSTPINSIGPSTATKTVYKTAAWN